MMNRLGLGALMALGLMGLMAAVIVALFLFALIPIWLEGLWGTIGGLLGFALDLFLLLTAFCAWNFGGTDDDGGY